MKNRVVNTVFPIILFVLLCVAVIAVATAPRLAEPQPPQPDPASSGQTQTDPGQTDPGQTGGPAEPSEPDAPSEPQSQLPDPAAVTDPEPAEPEQGDPSVYAEPDDLSVDSSADQPADRSDPSADPSADPSDPSSEPAEPAGPIDDGPEQTDGDSGDNGSAPPFDVTPVGGSGSDSPDDSDEPDPAPGTDTDEPGQKHEISASLAAFSPEVRNQIASMSDRELLTQMFIATYDGSWATAGYAADYGFGGYITFAEDYENDTPESFREGVDRVTAASKIPPLYAVDEEGGTVTRASKYPGYRRFPFLSPREVYEAGGIDLIRSDAAEKAELLKKLGLNYNLAPVADISVSSSDYMYNRSPGQDPETTASIVETIVTMFNQRGVASTVKHFPGYGAVSDTHTAMAWDGRTVEELESFDLIPFRRAMAAGVPSVMVSHIITALDPDRPASVSSKVVDYIRTNMGYDGVLITDDMRMNGILDFCTTGNGSLEAILAGYDLICCTNWPEQFPVVWDAVENGTLTRDRLELSAARVLRMKQDLGIWVP